jgi:N-acetylmuramoyl-L-alanine amidase
MSSYHIVKQGEHLSGIAKQYGFSDYRTIWLHGENAALKAKRLNPNVIFPDDRLFIPDKTEREEPRPTDALHRFRVEKPPLKLRLVLEDLYERPIANAKCDLVVESDTRRLTTDGRGKLEQDIPADARQASLIVHDPQTPADEIAIAIDIGHLDPVEEVSGQKARLNNLGYFAGPFEGVSDEDNNLLFRSAVEEFQCDHGLTVDGKCGPGTQARLKQVHGC